MKNITVSNATAMRLKKAAFAAAVTCMLTAPISVPVTLSTTPLLTDGVPVSSVMEQLTSSHQSSSNNLHGADAVALDGLTSPDKVSKGDYPLWPSETKTTTSIPWLSVVHAADINLLEAAAEAGDWASVLRQANKYIAADRFSGADLGRLHAYRALALLAQDNPTDALTAAEEAAKLAPNLEDAWLAQGTAYLRLRQLAKAEQAYDMAAKVAPESWKPARNLAVLASVRGDVPASIDLYEKALKQNRKDAALYAEYAMMLNRSGLPAKAEAVLTTLSMITPKSPDVWNNRGMVRLALDNYQGAMQDFTRAVEVAPDHAEALLNRGNIYRVRGKLAESLADFDTALAKPDAKDKVTPKLYIGRAYTLSALKRYEDAATDFAAAYELGNIEPYVMNEYAWFLATCPVDGLRDGKRAVQIAEQAILLTPEPNVGMLDTLGAAHAEAGDFEKAVKIQEQVLRLSPHLPVMMRDEWAKRLQLYRKGVPFRSE